MKYLMLTYQDLVFLVPKGWKPSDPRPKKFMVFFNNKYEAEDACLFLRSRVSRKAQEYIKWFYASMSTFYRSEEIKLFKTGESQYGLELTDVGGMVSSFQHISDRNCTNLAQRIDLPDIQIIVQWKVPTDLNTLMQRFGHGVRNPSLMGITILITEPWYFYDEHQKSVRRRAGHK